jgi:hypothetical protein
MRLLPTFKAFAANVIVTSVFDANEEAPDNTTKPVPMA